MFKKLVPWPTSDSVLLDLALLELLGDVCAFFSYYLDLFADLVLLLDLFDFYDF